MFEEDNRPDCTCCEVLIAEDCLLLVVSAHDCLGFHVYVEAQESVLAVTPS